MREAEVVGERPGDGTFAARRGTVDRNDGPLHLGVGQSHILGWRRAALTGTYAYGKAPRRTPGALSRERNLLELRPTW